MKPRDSPADRDQPATVTVTTVTTEEQCVLDHGKLYAAMIMALYSRLYRLCAARVTGTVPARLRLGTVTGKPDDSDLLFKVVLRLGGPSLRLSLWTEFGITV